MTHTGQEKPTLFLEPESELEQELEQEVLAPKREKGVYIL